MEPGAPALRVPAGHEPTGAAELHDAPRITTVPRSGLLVGAVVAQAALGRVLYLQPILVLPHAAAVLGIIVWSSLRRRPDQTLLVVAYLTSAEVMWRQARGPIPAQTGPYLAIIAGVLAMLTAYPHVSKTGRKAFLYIGLLLPSSLITISVASGTARQALSFALAGPVAIAVLIAWFSQVRITGLLYRRVLWAMLISGIGPLTIAVTNISDYIGTGQRLSFSDQSNFITSGGFGPVQVSSVLGLTALVAALLVLVERDLVVKVLVIAIGVGAGAQSLLTFSRGGMTATALALGGLAISQARNPETRRRVVVAIVVFFSLAWFLVVPRIDSFTQGKFNQRFSDTSSGRTNLAANDVEIFKRNVLFGVGPGLTKYQRLSYETCRLRVDQCNSEGSSHTEFTRMLSEHGLAGLMAIVVMASLTFDALRRAGPSRGITIVFLTWAIAQMFYANIRVVAIAIIFAFAFLLIGGPNEDQHPAPAIADPDATAS